MRVYSNEGEEGEEEKGEKEEVKERRRMRCVGMMKLEDSEEKNRGV